MARASLLLLLAVAVTSSLAAKLVFPKLKSPVKGYKYTKVFGVPVFVNASAAKFQHVASMLAEWIDNDGDGCADTPAILKTLLPKNGTPLGMVVTHIKDDSVYAPFGAYDFKAPMKASDVIPKCSGLLQTEACFDTTQEEVFHVVSCGGYAGAFKKQFGLGTDEQAAKNPSAIKSGLAKLLDAARGGIARSPTMPAYPTETGYPSKAWYTYLDASCNFGCQECEYWWMGTAALTGIHNNRGQSITQEYKYTTKAAFKQGDPKLYAMLTDTSKGYRLPTRAPDGKYYGKKTCSSGTNVI